MQGSRTHERSGSTTSVGSAAKGEYREGSGRSKSPAEDRNQGPPLAWTKVKSGATEQHMQQTMKDSELTSSKRVVTLERDVYRGLRRQESARITPHRMRGRRAPTGRREAGDGRSVA